LFPCLPAIFIAVLFPSSLPIFRSNESFPIFLGVVVRWGRGGEDITRKPDSHSRKGRERGKSWDLAETGIPQNAADGGGHRRAAPRPSLTPLQPRSHPGPPVPRARAGLGAAGARAVAPRSPVGSALAPSPPRLCSERLALLPSTATKREGEGSQQMLPFLTRRRCECVFGREKYYELQLMD